METTRLAPLSVLLRTAVRRYRDYFRTIAGVAGFYALGTIGVGLVVGALGLAGLLAFKGNVAAIVTGGIVLLVLAIAAFFLLMAVFNMAFAYIAIAQEPLTVSQAIDRGWQGALQYVWLVAVQGAFIIGGYMLFLVPGLIFSALVSVSVFALVAEGQRGVAALSRSWSYVSERKWAVFWRFGVFALLIGVMFAAARILVLSVTGAMGTPRNSLSLRSKVSASTSLSLCLW